MRVEDETQSYFTEQLGAISPEEQAEADARFKEAMATAADRLRDVLQADHRELFSGRRSQPRKKIG